MARYRRGLAWGIACVVLTDLIALTQPQVLRFAVDDLYRGVTAAKLGRYAVILFAIAVASGLFKFWMRLAVIGISRHLEYDLRNQLFAHLQRLPLRDFQHARTGEIMSRATNDLSAVRMMLGPGLMYLVNTLVVALVSIGFMLAISPRLTLLSLLPLPLVSLAVWVFGERIERRFEEIQAHFATISARVQENLAGVRVVRAFAREAGELEDFRALNRDYLAKNLALISTSGFLNPGLAFLSGIAALLALYLGGRQVVAGHITLGQFVAFTVYLGMLNWPMVALGWVVNLFQRGLASYRRILEILDAPAAEPGPRIERRAPAPEAVRVRGEIEFRHLTFSYPGASRPALRDVCFTVPAGRTVAIVGRTGAGKSTLLALLPRLFEPPPGTVFLDGRDVCGATSGWRRRTRSCSRRPWPRTSPTASSTRTRRRSSASPRSPGSTATCASFQPATPRAWASAASRSRAGRSSARPSPARCCAMHPCCCSTTACRAWTPTPRRPSWAACVARWRAAPRSSSRTA